MQKYNQNIAEAIIPLLGFYYWGWSWYFILLFLILDAIAKVFILHLKSQKIYATQGGEKSKSVWIKSGVFSLGVDFTILALLHLMYSFNHENFNVGKEIIDFLSYEELGLAQGWIFVPLVVLNVWMQYKFTFLKLKQHTKIQISGLWKEYLMHRYIVLGIVILGCAIHFFVSLNDVVFVWVSALLPFGLTELSSRLR